MLTPPQGQSYQHRPTGQTRAESVQPKHPEVDLPRSTGIISFDDNRATKKKKKNMVEHKLRPHKPHRNLQILPYIPSDVHSSCWPRGCRTALGSRRSRDHHKSHQLSRRPPKGPSIAATGWAKHTAYANIFQYDSRNHKYFTNQVSFKCFSNLKLFFLFKAPAEWFQGEWCCTPGPIPKEVVPK